MSDNIGSATKALGTKAAILEAAKSLFWDHGYESTSPRTIQDACGVGQGSFYHHFRTKKELAEAALTDVAHELEESLEEIFKDDKRPFNQLNDYLTTPRIPLKGCKIGRYAYEDSIHIEELRRPMEAYFDKLEEKIVAALDKLADEGRLDLSINREEVALAIISVIQGGYIVARVRQDEAAFHAAIAGAMSMLIHLIQ